MNEMIGRDRLIFHDFSKITDLKCILIDAIQYDVYLCQMAR